jgi:hypothetical protein
MATGGPSDSARLSSWLDGAFDRQVTGDWVAAAQHRPVLKIAMPTLNVSL